MAKTTTKASVKPLEQLQALLPGITHDELLRLTMSSLVEIGRRASEYADTICDIEDPPRDLANEAFSFLTRAENLMPYTIAGGPVKEAWRNVHYAQRDVEAVLNA